jgi:hypothetical protein
VSGLQGKGEEADEEAAARAERRRGAAAVGPSGRTAAEAAPAPAAGGKRKAQATARGQQQLQLATPKNDDDDGDDWLVVKKRDVFASKPGEEAGAGGAGEQCGGVGPCVPRQPGVARPAREQACCTALVAGSKHYSSVDLCVCAGRDLRIAEPALGAPEGDEPGDGKKRKRKKQKIKVHACKQPRTSPQQLIKPLGLPLEIRTHVLLYDLPYGRWAWSAATAACSTRKATLSNRWRS